MASMHASRLFRGFICLVLLSVVVPTGHASTPVCGRLCARWELDAAASDNPITAIDKALLSYKEEKPRRRHMPSDITGMANAELDESLGPFRQRPQKDELREQLSQVLVIPPAVAIRVDGDEIIVEAGRSTRRFEPGEPYSRVDKIGTAEITAKWQHEGFQVRESYKKGRDNREAYTFDAKSERLIVTRTIDRPSLPTITVKSIYHAAAPASPAAPPAP